MSGRTPVFVVISVILLLSSCSMIDNHTGEGDNRIVRETGIPASAEGDRQILPRQTNRTRLFIALD